MPRARKKLLTQIVIEAGEIIPIGCMRCGLKEGQGALLYPFPVVEGTMWCPNCSPTWLKSLLDCATANQQMEINGTSPAEGEE
jgi:hypothetical protein